VFTKCAKMRLRPGFLDKKIKVERKDEKRKKRKKKRGGFDVIGRLLSGVEGCINLRCVSCL